jgi:hypothetical protein
MSQTEIAISQDKPTAKELVEAWLKEQGFNVVEVELSYYQQTSWKWNAGGEWRFYLYSTNLMFNAYNIYTCSWMTTSLSEPDSLTKVSEWIKKNKHLPV